MSGIATRALAGVEAARKSYRLAKGLGYTITGHPDDDQLGSIALALCSDELLAKSELVWIAGDMVDLLKHAAQSLPVYRYTPDVLPWPSALCLSSKPLMKVHHPDSAQEVDVEAVQWHQAGKDAVIVTGLTYYHGPDLLAPMLVNTLKPNTDWDQLRGETHATDGGQSFAPLPDTGGYASLICTLWLLLQQKVAVKRRTQPDRADRRRWGREHDSPIPDVTVIELRRPIHSSPHEDSPVDEVEWSHRWIVDGHWRNQYHPSTGTHVPTWIAPYVKGPEDKPLLVKQKIHAWVR